MNPSYQETEVLEEEIQEENTVVLQYSEDAVEEVRNITTLITSTKDEEVEENIVSTFMGISMDEETFYDTY